MKKAGPNIVEKLLETLRTMKNFEVFSTFPLFLAVKKHGYLMTGTLKKDRTKNCPLQIEKDLKRKGRGSHGYRTHANGGISITK